MGISKKLHQMDENVMDSEKWVTSAIPFKSSTLKPIFTKPTKKTEAEEEEEEEDYCSTTPTSEESIIPRKLICPPAPKKRKAASSKCAYGGGVREFFNPPDLESIFVRRVT